jgi:hypothetical protein
MFLETLVAQVEAKFPAVIYKNGKGSRAQAAAELVRAQQVTFAGIQGGHRWWNVNGHMCSISATCNCSDNAPTDPKGRKLCKHRLAVMFVRRMQDDHGLAAILSKTAGDRVVLTVQVLYADDGQQNALNSYRADGVDTVLEYEDRIRFTDAEFVAALRDTGWGMTDRPVKMAALNHRYILKRGAEIAYTSTAMTAEHVTLSEQRKVMKEIAVAEQMNNELAAEAA